MSRRSRATTAAGQRRRSQRVSSSRPRSVWLVGVAVGLAAIWVFGLVSFVQLIERQPQIDQRRTDAIVVLTGGSERMSTGLALLTDSMAEKMFVSGVYKGVDVAELLRLSRQDPAEVECCIDLGYEADDTRGNAVETAVWMRAEGFTSLRLVTANYHMPRSLLQFRRIMPDVDVVAHPVAPTSVRLDEWWRWPGTFSLLVSEYHKYWATRLAP